MYDYYRPEIFQGITNALVPNHSMNYTKLYKRVVWFGKTNYSHTEFSSHLSNMVKDDILAKNLGRQRSACYSLTDNSIAEYKLKILGVGKEYETRRGLYQLLISFDAIKRGNLYSDKQLPKSLKKMDTGLSNLRKIRIRKRWVQAMLKSAFLDDINEIEVSKFSVSNKYYVVTYGFSVNEFIYYISKMREGTEPKPFSRYQPVAPLVYYLDFSKDDVRTCINLLEELGLLRKITNSSNIDEIRYNFKNKSVLETTSLLRLIEFIFLNEIFIKCSYFSKCGEEDKEFLTYYFGVKATDRIIANMTDHRRQIQRENKKNKYHEIDYVAEACRNMEKLKSLRLKLVKIFKEKELKIDRILRNLIISSSFK